jgi:hypothetical protein
MDPGSTFRIGASKPVPVMVRSNVLPTIDEGDIDVICGAATGAGAEKRTPADWC